MTDPHWFLAGLIALVTGHVLLDELAIEVACSLPGLARA